MAKKVQITAEHLIATLDYVETCCKAVREALQSIKDPTELVMHFDDSRFPKMFWFMPAGVCADPPEQKGSLVDPLLGERDPREATKPGN